MATHPQTTHNRHSKTYLPIGGPDGGECLPRPIAVSDANLVNPNHSSKLYDGEIVKITSEANSLRPVVSRVVAEDLDRGDDETGDISPNSFALATYSGSSTADCQVGRVINVQRKVGHRFRYRLIDPDQLADYTAGVALKVALINYDTATDSAGLIPKMGVSGTLAGLVPCPRVAGTTFEEYVAILDAVDDANGWIEAHWAPGVLPPVAAA